MSGSTLTAAGSATPKKCPPPPPKFPPTEADFLNIRLAKYLVAVWCSVIAFVLIQRLLIVAHRHIRRMVSLNNEKQIYFSRPDSRWAFYKRHWLDAPLFSKRHNRDFEMSSTLSAGIVPSRIQSVLVVAYLILNIVFCSISLPAVSHKIEFLNAFYHRAGVIAVTNMIPLFVFAGRNNPLILLLGFSFDTYNLLHRWLGRMAVLEAIMHAIGFALMKATLSGWYCFWHGLGTSTTLLTGAIGVSCFVTILFQSPSLVRRAFYETFLHIHILLAATVLGVIWIHLRGLPVQLCLNIIIVVWIVERCFRLFRLIRNNVGAGGTMAEVEALPGDAMRVSLRLARPWKFQPGQHVFLYIPAVGWWTSHPFSLAWSSEYHDGSIEKQRLADPLEAITARKSTMSLIIRRRTGFTERLWQKAENSPHGKFITRAFVEGPYGSQSFASYGTVMLFAAGVGITHQVPFLREVIAAFAEGTGATRKLTLVWIIQSPEHLEWIRPWMADILGMDKRRDVLRIMLFVTRPRSTKEIHSPSASVQMFPGKPDVHALISQAQQAQTGAMAVSVCGTGSLSDDVRAAVRSSCQRTTIDFVDNAFSW